MLTSRIITYFISTIFLIIVLIRTKVCSFNIETRDPIVKKVKKNSYFGFSVAQHAVNENSKNIDDYWILVGAPKGKNLQPLTNRSGALYKCPISTLQNDCIQIETDGKRFDEDDFDYDDTPTLRDKKTLQPPGHDEIKEDQWLGVSVKSQKPGGKVMVCAHRYIQSPNLTSYHYGMGLCYLLNKDLIAEEALQPCKGLPTDKLHQQYGYCQVGTSLAVLHDGYALMGAPGPYTWRGSVFAKDVERPAMEKDLTNYKGPLNDDSIIDKYSYLGMSVSGGHFFNKTTFHYVSGAPRSNNTGQVYFFDRVSKREELGIVKVISGMQFAASFGYEILVVDINQDGLDELLVAAPFYYSNNEGGAVYLYKNLKLNEDTLPDFKWTGKLESRFGFSMTSLGDINKDGYIDVAIGAPYESEGGAVYIYLGQENGLSKEPSQIIKHKRHKTVGYSMSGGLDMDLNGYPDLLVGAYESDEVFFYKTRPIIDITITVTGDELKNINATRKGCFMDPTVNKTCFSFNTCFSLSNFKPTEPVDIKYEVKEITKKVPRVNFNNSKAIIKVTDKSSRYCIDEAAYLVESNGDILTPIQLQVNYTIYNDNYHSPILNKTSLKKFEATFQKNCGDDDVCMTNLVLTAGTLLNLTDEGYVMDLGKNKEFVLDVNVTNLKESAYEAKLFVLHPGLSYIALQSTKNKTSSIVCTANENSSVVSCNLGNPFPENAFTNLRLRFEVADTKQQKLELQVKVNSTSVELSNQTSQEMTVILQKIASYSINGEGKPKNIFYSGEIRGQSAMHHLGEIGPRVIHSYNVINREGWNIRGLRVDILWPYQVYSERPEGGKWLLYLEKVPSFEFLGLINNCSVENAEQVVNPLKLPAPGSEEEIQEYRGFTEGPVNVRRRRDVENVVKTETLISSNEKARNVVTMDCLNRTALCTRITCNIPQLYDNIQIRINITARVWNSTLIEDYSHVDWVTIISRANVTIDDSTIVHSYQSISLASVSTTAYPVALADKGVNIWIIIGSVLAGLLLLILVIIILYKCGFFKRNRIKDHTLSANLTKKDENETLLKETESKPAKR